MRERPALPDELINASLRDQYRIQTARLDFLPIGNDARAWVYRVTACDLTLFLKVRQGAVSAPSLLVPRALRDQGIEQVVAPISTLSGELSTSLDSFTLIVYPFIDGTDGMSAGLSADQWAEFGAILRRIHQTRLSPRIAAQVETESFRPRWADRVREVDRHIATHLFDDPIERDCAAFWREKQAEIAQIVTRCEALGESLRGQASEFVLCHADIHKANLLIDARGGLHIVDWDQPLWGPVERDLTFVLNCAADGSLVRSSEERAFLSGYGDVPINQTALAYYRYEWVVQELGDYGERVFLRADAGQQTKRESAIGVWALFESGDVVEVAYQADPAQDRLEKG